MVHFKPNLFIPGAAKSGTTTLHNLLNNHPDICMSSNKEPVYWNNAEFDNLNDEAKIKYSNIFKDKTKKIIGESTTSYMFYDSFIERVNKNYETPPKLIFVLRNPIDRFNSHYWWMKGLGLEKQNFENALNNDLKKEFKPYSYYPKYYFQFGLYAKWLSRFYDYFDKSQIKIITFEKLIEEQLETANSCFEFLKVDKLKNIRSDNSNQTAILKNPRLYHFLNKSAIGKYSYTKIGKYLLPKRTIEMIKTRIKGSLQKWDKENIKYPKLTKEYRSKLKVLYSKDIYDLKKITNYNFNEWTDFNSLK